MQPRLALLVGLAATSILAGAAFGQTKSTRQRLPAPVVAADLTLPAPKPAPATPASPRLVGLGGLTGMKPVGDPTPACRAQCSKDRYVCHAGGDSTDCDSRWIPCLHSCSAP